MSKTRLIYLHGFNSSPDSYKARVLKQVMQQKKLAEYLEIPAIPPAPLQAIEMLMACANTIQETHNVAFAGSSLGGFYATVLAERFSSKAVLINPAVHPHKLLEKYLGENVNYYTSERWVLNETHIQQFRELDFSEIKTPENYLVLVQAGDETLDYRDAASRYADCSLVVEEGGNHSFVDFEKHIDRLLEFCEITH